MTKVTLATWGTLVTRVTRVSLVTRATWGTRVIRVTWVTTDYFGFFG